MAQQSAGISPEVSAARPHTYEKGSAALKQLNYLVGPEAFRRGVGDYLKTHAYGNTTLGDFLDAISAAAGRDLEAWSQEWLLEPGTNSVAVKLECEDERISSLSLIQGAPQDWPTRRTHRTQLGLYRFEGDEVIVQTLPIVAIVPLVGLWLGFNFSSRVIVCVVMSLFPIITNTLFGLKSADPGLHDLATLHNASRWTRLRTIAFPNALPAMFTGIRIAGGLSVIGAIVSDFFFRQGYPGIGRLLDIYRANLNYEGLIAAIFASSSLGIVVFWFIFDFMSISVGLYSAAILPDIVYSPYLDLADFVLPPLFRAMFIIALLSVVMSTIDSFIFISGYTFGVNILSEYIPRKKSDLNELVKQCGVNFGDSIFFICEYIFC